jgi:hypothetical protein
VKEKEEIVGRGMTIGRQMAGMKKEKEGKDIKV